MSQLARASSSVLRAICAILFLAAAPAAHATIVDDFGDGNDTTPAWSHLDPTLGATFAAPSLSYLISVGATGNALDPARAFSLREDASFADVVVAADLVDFDAVTDHLYGIAARSTSTLAPTHDGYALVLTAPGTLSLIQLDNQVATTLASVPVTVSSSADYRLVLSATGSSPVQLVGKIFAASDLAQPIATVRYADSLAPIYLSGFTGFLVADGSALQDEALSASFDAFFASAPNADADADGLSDGMELSIGTDPSDPDTDNDGLLDGVEIGTGVFGPQISISTQADGARMVMTADMDGDGDIDVLSASFDDTTIAWHENDGTPLDGPWAEHLITTIGDRPTTLFPADIDGDGDTDVVAASSPDFGVSWYENDGTPAVGPWTERPITASDGGEFSNVQKVSAADMDNDGDTDLLAVSGPNGALVWYENDGTPAVGVWTPHPISISATSFIATDIDSDGNTDGLTISPFDFIAWYENDGTPAVGVLPEHQLAVNVGQPIRWVHAADFDGDGDTDVLSRSVADYIVWYENDGTPAVGDWPGHPVSSGAGSSFSSYPSDVDGDGDMDVLAAENNAFEVTWYENDGTPAVGTWTRRVISIAQFPEWVVTADIDGDGDADAISASFFDDKIAWYQQQNVADPLDPDTDDDGLLDGFEVAYGFNPLVAGEQGQDADGDGLSNVAEQTAGTNPNLSDTDGDGLFDGFEVTYGFNPLLAGEQGQDPDGDALVNFNEQAAGTNPHVADTDGDGLLDGPEVANGLDPLDSDTDDDGLSDSVELNIHGTNPLLADTDGDGLGDGAEVNTYGTSPILADTDGDGLLDGFETAYGFNPLLGGQQNQDPDGDGLTNLQEQSAGTNPNLADSDGDGLSDSAELNTYGTNPVLADSDVDGINDGSELSIGTDPLDADSDDDGLSDGAEIAIGTNPLDGDTDDDGLGDAMEVNIGTNPLLADTDGDGLSDSAEVSAQTNPLLRDTDGDEMSDYFEVVNDFDPLYSDQNDNGIFDGHEDRDGDGLSNLAEDATHTNPSDPDTDDDGLLDGAEIGTGVFGPQISISTQADGARMVMTADMDGDGDIDVLSASFDDTTIAWHENDGTPLDGPWAEHLITTIGDRPTTLFPADIDGDGDTDVVAASSPDFGVSWYENDGTPAVGPWTERPITANDGGEFSNVQKVSAADMDNDGDTDLLATSGPNAALVWYENDGTPAVGVWAPHPISISATSFIATDIDSDGNTDGLTISPFDFIAWYENDGTPAVGALPEHQLAVNVGQPIRWVHAADFDGDGDTDVLSRSVADYIVWYENDGTPAVGDWPGHPVSSGAGSSISSYPSDVDGDGDMDVLAAENNANEVTWYENDGTPAVGAWTRHVISIANYPEWVVTADIDGDGDADAVSASFFDDKIAWYEQQNVADPLDPDTDDDGLLDGFEVANGIDPLDADSDNDGLGDGTEVNTYGSNPLLADTDGDAAIDGSDNCPVTANPSQSDVGGVASGLPDGVGDACQCGDVNDSGVVDSADVVAYRDSLANPSGQPLTPAGVGKCSVIGVAAPCEVLDVSVIRRALEAPPLLPGIAQVCSAARAP